MKLIKTKSNNSNILNSLISIVSQVWIIMVWSGEFQ